MLNKELEKKLKKAILLDEEIRGIEKTDDFVDLEEMFIKRNFPKPEPKNLDSIHQSFNNIIVDLFIQRREVWKEKQKKEYIESVISGKSPTNILIANVRECLNESKRSNDIEGIEYFENCLKNKKTYILLDGNNRTQTINSLLNGDLTFPNMNVTFLDDNNEYKTINLENQNIKWLDKNYQKAANKIRQDFKIYITKATNTTYKDLSNIFEQVNKLVDLNNQEKQNGTISKNMGIVREKLQNEQNKNEGTILRKSTKTAKSNLENSSINSFITPIEIKLEDFNEMVFEKILLNDNLQRNEVWTKKSKENYIKSLIKGMSFSNITLAALEQSINNLLDELEEINNQSMLLDFQEAEKLEKELEYEHKRESLEYFIELKEKGYEYISIDGNNRLNTIKDLLKGDIEFPKIIIKNKISENKYNYINLEGLTYNDLLEMEGKDKDIVKLLIKTPVGINRINKIDMNGLNEILKYF